MTAPPKPTPKRSRGEWRPVFLVTLKRTGNVRAACTAAVINRASAYDARDADTSFAAAWEAAMEEATDELESIARRRAKSSSDTLLIFLLKAHRPAKFRDNYSLEVSGKDGGPIEIRRFIGVDVDSV